MSPAALTCPQISDLVSRLDGTTLCIQGPPGTGKTFTAAAVIVDLLKQGKRVGVTATSHKVILNLLGAVVEAREEAGEPAGSTRSAEGGGRSRRAGHERSDRPDRHRRTWRTAMAPGVLVGGTAWVFTREELQGKFDYLFIDEAGQVCLANAVAVGLSARNLVLVGDQMQLAPADPGQPSRRDRQVLPGVPARRQATVPPIWASSSASPIACTRTSAASSRTRSTKAGSPASSAAQRHRDRSQRANRHWCRWRPESFGIPVDHDGCAQCSDEEVEAIRRDHRRAAGPDGGGQRRVERPMTPDDILYRRSVQRPGALPDASCWERQPGLGRWTSSRGRRRRS